MIGKAWPVALLFGISACRTEEGEPGDSLRDSGDTSSAQDSGSEGPREPRLLPSPLGADFACDPTLESLQETIFEKSCHWDTCHGNNDAAWGLRLAGVSTESVRAGMVGVTAGTCPGWVLVAPGNPEASFLLEKLKAEPACGEPMPRGVEPLPGLALDCIRDWIASL
jgi:hypothetical protein